MRGSLKILTVAGIGIYIHWTFLLLLGWVFSSEAVGPGGDARSALGSVAFVLAIFGCVTLHELGHALTAARFGIRTRDITMLPIGGVARLERIPADSLQEFLITIAGPAVNVAIAVALGAFLLATGGFAPLAEGARAGAGDYIAAVGFPERLLFANIFLAVFNLIPAFPMDGGRILRAILAVWMPYGRATRAAAIVGQVLAFGFGILGLVMLQPMLALIGVFVFLGARAEVRAARARELFTGLPVSEAMMTEFRSLPATMTIADASRESLAGAQQDFPVTEEGRIVGVLLHGGLVEALDSRPPETPVSEVMRRDCGAVEESAMLDAVYGHMRQTGCGALLVTREGRVVGLVTVEGIAEVMKGRAKGGSARKPV